MTEPDLSHSIELAPAFHDLDPLDIVWHGHYVKYLEIARCALLAKFNYDYPQMRESGYAWPIVDMRLKYVGSASFNQRLIVQAKIVEWEMRLKIEYVISDALSGQMLTKAHTTQVALSIATREMQYVCPAVLWQRLGVVPV
ncbi:acyl-CoA thioesterase [Roseateles oligotrophus]|uniref:Acyl-CoA thioesterase n=1 Tax=Roseateles oligotrophus TaxID=1769250 RepID=A0ABT2YDF0_9BURK|nr:acyl-CoA thioesterase [Roseateles oligotrophus]MCV2368077.1 acyl-CoA thioesterase [Roseateles oligotrophus]